MAFITTTCLDFNHAFKRNSMKDAMVYSLLDDCRHYGAKLEAWVVMVHHLHLLVRVPPDRDVSWFVQRIKSNSAKALLPKLTSEELAGFDQQRGLNRRSFWKRGFRSVPIRTEPVFFQKARYIHENPVKASLCVKIEDYRWSSGHLWEEGRWTWDEGLAIPEDYGDRFL